MAESISPDEESMPTNGPPEAISFSKIQSLSSTLFFTVKEKNAEFDLDFINKYFLEEYSTYTVGGRSGTFETLLFFQNII
jgi:hypothetical protein